MSVRRVGLWPPACFSPSTPGHHNGCLCAICLILNPWKRLGCLPSSLHVFLSKGSTMYGCESP